MLHSSIETFISQIVQSSTVSLLCLLDSLVTGRAVQPERHKCQPAQYGNPDTADPDPSAANLETPRVFIVRKVSNSDLSLLIDVGDKGAAVVDAEVEDSMLVGRPEGDTKDGRVCGPCDGSQVEALERREHAELELDVIVLDGLERNKAVVFVFGDFDLEVLCAVSSCLYKA